MQRWETDVCWQDNKAHGIHKDKIVTKNRLSPLCIFSTKIKRCQYWISGNKIAVRWNPIDKCGCNSLWKCTKMVDILQSVFSWVAGTGNQGNDMIDGRWLDGESGTYFV